MLKKSKKLKSQKIRTKPSATYFGEGKIYGTLDGKQTRICIRGARDSESFGVHTWIFGQSLYRLAKAIVRHMEADRG